MDLYDENRYGSLPDVENNYNHKYIIKPVNSYNFAGMSRHTMYISVPVLDITRRNVYM